jgi:sugar phosphate isomerase/epimerase
MDVAFATLIGVPPLPFPDLVAKSAEIGVHALEVNLGPGYRQIGDAAYHGHLDLDAINNGDTASIQETLAQHNVTICSLAPMLNLLVADESLRAERIAIFRATIDACAQLDVPTAVTFAGSAHGMHFFGLPGVGEGHPTNMVSDNLRHFRDVYGPLAQYAESKGIKIAFETAARGGGAGNVAHAPELWDAIFNTVDSPAIGLAFDPSHLVWLQIPNIAGLIRDYRDRIFFVDGKDTEVLPDRLARQGIFGNSWWRYRLPGMGDLDWRPILSALSQIGYDGPISIENEDPLCPGFPGIAWSAAHLNNLLEPFAPTSADAPLPRTAMPYPHLPGGPMSLRRR